MKKRLIAVLLAVLLMVPTLAVANDEADIAITAQPGNIEAPLGATGFARVEAEAEGELTYRWYWREAEEEEWTEADEQWEGCDADTLYRETARRFGYKTLSPKARQRLEGVRRY